MICTPRQESRCLQMIWLYARTFAHYQVIDVEVVRFSTRASRYNRSGLIGVMTAAGLFFHTVSSASTYNSISFPSGSWG